LIKNNQKAKMEDMRNDTRSKMDQFKSKKTESDFLNGIGNGILRDLEDDLNVSSRSRIDDSSIEAFIK
jgi:hypothetical protein